MYLFIYLFSYLYIYILKKDYAFVFLFSIYITLYFNVLNTVLRKNQNTDFLFIYLFISLFLFIPSDFKLFTLSLIHSSDQSRALLRVG